MSNIEETDTLLDTKTVTTVLVLRVYLYGKVVWKTRNNIKINWEMVANVTRPYINLRLLECVVMKKNYVLREKG